MTIKNQLAALALCLVLPLSAQAHKAWILPSATVLSDHAWITFDAAVSNDLFYFNHVPIKLDNLVITAPDGTSVPAQNPFTGKYRSSFDLELVQSGTYRVALFSNAVGGDRRPPGAPGAGGPGAGGPAPAAGGPGGGMAAPAAGANQPPREPTQSIRRNETFVTSGKPSDTALKLAFSPANRSFGWVTGISSRPTPVSFKFALDGKPAANLELEIVPGGSRYRDSQQEIKVTTDKDGLFSVTWPAAGMYWIEASVQDDKATIAPAKKRRVGYTATLEVLPQ